MKKEVVTVISILLVAAAFIGGLKYFNKKGDDIGAVKTVESLDEAKIKEKIKVAYVEAVESHQILLDFAKNKGYFAKNNVDVELLSVKKGTDVILASGQADVVLGGLPGFLALYLNDNETRWIAAVNNPTGYGVSRFSREEAKKIKKVAIVRFGGMPQMMTIIALERLGVDLSSVEYVAIPDDAGKANLMEKREIDFAMFESNKFVDENLSQKNYSVYDSLEITKDPLLSQGIFTMQKTIDEKPRQLQEFVNAIHQTINYIDTNKDEVTSYLQNERDYSAEASQRIYAIMEKTSLKDFFKPEIEKISGRVEMVNKEFETKNKTRPIDKFIHAEFVEKVQ